MGGPVSVKFSDIFICKMEEEFFQVFKKLTKCPVHWSSKIPTNYKRNAITSELHRARKTATDFDKELRRIKTKFLPAGYPVKLINDTSFIFNEEKEELLILKCLFDETKLVVMRLPFAPKMGNLVSILLVNYRLLSMATSDFTLFGIPTRYSLFSITKLRYNI